MKSIFKLTTAALALFAFASCSTDDIFGNGAEDLSQNGIRVEVEDLLDPVTTRAAYAPSVGNKPFFQDKDYLMVFDKTMTKFDLYNYNGAASRFSCDKETPNLSDPMYALFGGAMDTDAEGMARIQDPKTTNIVYGSWKWDYDTNSSVAEFYIPNEWKWAETTVGTNKTEAYISQLPLWGDVVKDETYGIATTMRYLTAVLRVNLSNVPGNAKFIMVDAWNDEEGTEPAWISSTAPLTGKGKFIATLAKDNETLENPVLTTEESEIEATNYSNTIIVPVNEATREKTVLYIPLIARKYGLLRVSYTQKGEAPAADQFSATDASTNWVPLKILTEKINTFERGKVYGATIETFNTSGNTPSALSSAINTKKDASGDIEVVTQMVTTNAAGDNTVTIPAMPNATSLTLTLQGIEGIEAEKTMNFDGEEFSGKVTINLVKTAPAILNKLNLNIPNADVVIVGKTAAGLEITGKAKTLTIGDGSTEMVTGVLNPAAATGDILVKAKATVGNINVTGNTKATSITVDANGVAGVISAQVLNAMLTKVKVNVIVNGTSGNVVTYGDVTVGGTVNGSVTTEGNVTVNTATEADAIATALNLADGATLTWTQGYIATITGPDTEGTNADVQFGADAKYTAVKVVEGNVTFKGTSKWNGKKVGGAETEDKAALQEKYGASQANIYTAIQLAQFNGSQAATLYADIDLDGASKANWEPKALTEAFDGKKHTIKNINVIVPADGNDAAKASAGLGLFSTISANVSNLTLDGVKVDAKQFTTASKKYGVSNIGALAGKSITNAVTIANVKVKKATLSSEAGVYEVGDYNIGGVVGSAENAIILNSVVVEASSITGYHSLGGYVGAAANNFTVAKASDGDKWVPSTAVTFAHNYDANAVSGDLVTIDSKYAQVGNFLGTFAAGKTLTISDIADASINATCNHDFAKYTKVVVGKNIENKAYEIVYPNQHLIGFSEGATAEDVATIKDTQYKISITTPSDNSLSNNKYLFYIKKAALD